MTRITKVVMVVAVLMAMGTAAYAADIVCDGGPCNGTDSNDDIDGSQFSDNIRALKGDDQVDADGLGGSTDGGRDIISGGPGGDELFPSSDDSTANGNDGQDLIDDADVVDTNDDDVLRGGKARDTLIANDGDDRDFVSGDLGFDICTVDVGDAVQDCEEIN